MSRGALPGWPGLRRRLHRQIRYRWRLLRARLARPVPDRLLTLHIGPHKTGTTTIQHMLAANVARLAPHLAVIPRNDPALDRLARLCWRLHGQQAVAQHRDEIRRHARDLALSVRHHRHTLASHEDLMGALPTRHGSGLYPGGAAKLRLIAQGVADAGARVEFVFYRRRYRNWLASLHRFRSARAKARPEAFRQRFDLPRSWRACIRRLRRSVPVTVLSFHDDQRDGRMGVGLLRHCGCSEQAIAGIAWAPPMKVTGKRGGRSRTETASRR